MTMDDGTDDEEDDESVKSAISNPSDLDDEEEEVEYLAMEIVNHLPPEQASKLLKNMQAKEKAVQDLVHRNRSLLSSCQKLDEENQALADRLQTAESASTAASTAAPEESAPAAPSPGVDMSFFAKMEQSKEEKILRLQKERDTLAAQCKRLDEGSLRLEQALSQTQKELKKLQQIQARGRFGEVQRSGDTGHGGGQPVASAPASLLDEEERIYQELQGNAKGSAAASMLMQRQEESNKRLHAAQQALLSDDLSRIERWGSDVAALLLAVDGMEAMVRPSKDKGGPKKAKGAAAGGAGAPDRQVERLQEVQAQLQEECGAILDQINASDKLQKSLEATCRGAQNGAEKTMAALDVGAGMHSKVLVLAQSLKQLSGIGGSLDTATDSLGHLEASLHELLCNSPPGLLPRSTEDCLREARQQLADVGKQVAEQASAIADLQDAVGTAEDLKALHQGEQEEMRQRAAEEIRRLARAFQDPLEPMRQSCMEQKEAISRARDIISGPLEQLSASLRKSVAQGGQDAGASGAGAFDKELNAASGDALVSGLREVRQICRGLVTSLEVGGKALEGRLHQACGSQLGEPPPAGAGGSGAAKGRSGAISASTAGGADTAEKDAMKKKRSKKKGKAEAEQPAPRTMGDDSKAETSKSQPLSGEVAGPGSAKGEHKDGQTPKRESRGALKGAELLQEMEKLRNQTEALEARMAERLKSKAKAKPLPDPDEDEDESEAKPAPKARRKKMFV